MNQAQPLAPIDHVHGDTQTVDMLRLGGCIGTRVGRDKSGPYAAPRTQTFPLGGPDLSRPLSHAHLSRPTLLWV